MREKITATINHNGDKKSLERTLRSVSGWVERIAVLKAGRALSGGKITGWVLGLNSGEEVSIPLKREIRTLFGGRHKSSGVSLANSYLIPIVRNAKDTWKLVCPGSERLFFTGGHGKAGNLENPVRDYIKHRVFDDAIKGVKIKRALVIKLRGIGDTILLTPLFRALKKSFPGVVIDVVVKEESAVLLSGQKDIKSSIAYRGFPETLSKLRGREYELALVPQASFRSALLARLSGAKLLAVNNHNGRNYFSSVPVDKPEEYENASERDLDCLRALGLKVAFTKPSITVTPAERKKALRLLKELGVKKGVAPVLVNPSASKLNKMWPGMKFAAFLDRISADKSVKALLLTDPANAEISIETYSLAGNKPVLLPSMPLRAVLGLISVAGLYIGNDSGLSHAAAALGTPTITIAGPDEPQIFHPYREEDGHYLVSKDRFCKPCWKQECAGRECLKAVQVSDVYGEYMKWKRSA